MTPIGLFYGTNTGFTEIVADLLVAEFETVAPNLITVHDIVRFAHVAVPLADIAPQLPHPLTGEPLATLAARLLAQATAVADRPPLWPRPDILLARQEKG